MHTFKKRLSGVSVLSVALVLGGGFANPAAAQDDGAVAAAAEEVAEPALGELELETVVVQGFRESLSEARDIKRQAVNSIESIVAEDIGKMPDLNLAKSLQRVPGLAISREGGEGRNITLRGFAPDFTRTTLNGMEVPASSDGLDSGGVTLNAGRSFDFHVFASELFNRIDVQKTQTASIEEGGIAGTVDLYSAKPFDFEGFNLLGSLQGGYNSVSEEIDPRAALLVSNTFANDTIGVLFSAAFSNRTVQQEGFSSVRWTSPFINRNSWADTNPVVTGTVDGSCGAVDPLDCLWAPRLPRADYFGNDQERLGLTGSVQFRPSEALELTLDVLHSELVNDRESYNSMEWLLTEVRMAPELCTSAGLSLDEAVEAMLAGFRRGAAGTDLTIYLILSAMRTAARSRRDRRAGGALARRGCGRVRHRRCGRGLPADSPSRRVRLRAPRELPHHHSRRGGVRLAEHLGSRAVLRRRTPRSRRANRRRHHRSTGRRGPRSTRCLRARPSHPAGALPTSNLGTGVCKTIAEHPIGMSALALPRHCQHRQPPDERSPRCRTRWSS